MREIKFRGKTLSDDHKWLYGNLNLNDDGKAAIMSIDDFWSLQSVNPATVGQYTGLKDCAGQEIYEGDIIKVRTQNPYWRFRRNFVVTWGEDGWLLDGDSLYSWFSLHTLEVIGNIYDNPEWEMMDRHGADS